jgi:hypothetical protein
MLEGLTSKLERWKVNEDQIWIESIDREVQFEIIRLNTQDQLFDEGKRADGTILDDYSETSVNLYGKRPGPIQLKDTGHFYQSFIVLAEKSAILIIADDVFIYDRPLADEYGAEIIGLTKENTGVLIRMLLKKYIKEIRKRII